MSTAIPAPAPQAAPAAKEISRPLLWLLGILALGLVLRLWYMKDAGFQVDEFTALAAVAERRGLGPGTTPTDAEPLVPVPRLADVRERSVIPYGVRDPVPLYHDLLWAVVQVLPVADWSLRLPSLLAGVGCIAAVFFLCRRLFGTEVALVAALFVALDPMQVATSWLARPFALANLAVVGSFAALWGLLQARGPARAALYAVGYAACVAAVGYLNVLLLAVVGAHVGMVVYAAFAARQSNEATGLPWKAGLWAAGLAAGAALLAPEFAYFKEVSAFAAAHGEYLKDAHGHHIFNFFWHNLGLLGGLLLVLAAGALIRMQLRSGGQEGGPEGEAAEPGGEGVTAADTTAAAPAAATAVTAAPAAAPAAARQSAAAEPEGEPLPENRPAFWMSLLWVVLPQVVLFDIAALAFSQYGEWLYLSRYLTYTTLGAAILLAYVATRDRSREVRLGVAAAVAVALLVFGYFEQWSLGGADLYSSPFAKDIAGSLANTDMNGSPGQAGKWVDGNVTWKPSAAVWGMEVSVPEWEWGDVVLLRAGLPEADFIRTDIPAETRPQVERVLLAPLTTLYPDRTHKPIILLSYSQYRSSKVKTDGGEKAPLNEFYDAEFAAGLKKYHRFWMTGVGPSRRPNTWQYLGCFLPWLATALDRDDLLFARSRGDRDTPGHYVPLKPNLGPDEPIKGLTTSAEPPWDRRREDFDNALQIVRPKTRDDVAREEKNREEKK
jgi:hypothetical protein